MAKISPSECHQGLKNQNFSKPILGDLHIHKNLPQIQFWLKWSIWGEVIRTEKQSFYTDLVIFQTPGLKAIGGGSRVKIRIFSGLDINRSNFCVLSCAFDGISKFGSVDPEFADLSGWVGPLRGSFLGIWRNSMTKEV